MISPPSSIILSLVKGLPEHFPHLTSTYAILRSELTRQSLC